MAIAIICPCGNQFSVPPSARGKAVKCPKCGKAIRVPGLDKANNPSSFLIKCECGKTLRIRGSAALAGLKCPSCGAPIKLKALPKKTPPKPNGPPCPNCGLPSEAGSGICLHCGTNLKTGQQLHAIEPAKEAAHKKRIITIMVAVAAVLVIAAIALFHK